MNHRLVLGLAHSKSCLEEAKRRGSDAYRIRMSKSEYEIWSNRYGRHNDSTRRFRKDNSKVVYEAEDEIQIEYKKPRWARFEDKVWNMFHSIGEKGEMALPIGDTVFKYDGPLTRQIDGVFSDSEYVYVVECKYRTTPKGAHVSPGNIREDLTQWSADWKPLCKALKKEEQFKGKKPVFILATRGVKITDKLRQVGERIDTVFLSDSSIEGIITMSQKIGNSSMASIFRPEIFRGTPHEKIPGLEKTFYATKIRIDGRNMYHFFAKSGDVVDLSHVPRRMPTGGDISHAYQRLIKPAKIGQIGRHLSERGAFFPNSIILATEEKVRWSKDGGDLLDANSEHGRLTIPNKYGCLFVIDGQHRLFGTEGASAEVREKKPLSICLIEGLEPTNQAQMFTSINQTQSKVDPDLLWDLYGELGSVNPPPDPDVRREVNMATQYVISNVWKRVNHSNNHPMSGTIKIPSHPTTSNSKISFGNTLCKYLFMRKGIWDAGFLRPKNGSWPSTENFAYARVSYFYKSLFTELSEEWEKDDKNWLRSNYSLIVITMVFTHMVEMFGGGARFKDDWNTDNFKKQIDDFVEVLANAIQSPDAGFQNTSEKRNILKAGSSSARADFARELVYYIRSNGRKGYGEFAPNIIEDDDKISPSNKTKKRVQSVETRFRHLIFNALDNKHGTKWFGKLPKDVKADIQFRIDEREILGQQFEDPPTIEYMNQTDTNHLFKIMSSVNTTGVQFFKHKKDPHLLPLKKDNFQKEWRFYSALRNLIAHHNEYPSENAKDGMLFYLGQMETYINIAEGKLAEEE